MLKISIIYLYPKEPKLKAIKVDLSQVKEKQNFDNFWR